MRVRARAGASMSSVLLVQFGGLLLGRPTAGNLTARLDLEAHPQHVQTRLTTCSSRQFIIIFKIRLEQLSLISSCIYKVIFQPFDFSEKINFHLFRSVAVY